MNLLKDFKNTSRTRKGIFKFNCFEFYVITIFNCVIMVHYYIYIGTLLHLDCYIITFRLLHCYIVCLGLDSLLGQFSHWQKFHLKVLKFVTVTCTLIINKFNNPLHPVLFKQTFFRSFNKLAQQYQ